MRLTKEAGRELAGIPVSLGSLLAEPSTSFRLLIARD
jgi:hypothetical protein